MQKIKGQLGMQTWRMIVILVKIVFKQRRRQI